QKQKDRKKQEKLGQEQKNKENADPVSDHPLGGAWAGGHGSDRGEGRSPQGGHLGIGCPRALPAHPSLPPQEELDLSCTFVCKAREKAGVRLPPLGSDRSPRTQNVEPSKKMPQKGSGDPVERPVPPQPLQPRPPSPGTLEQSLALAGHGIEAAQMGQHVEAVWAFTVALELNPQEHRLLGNRSYCLEKLGRYEEALADAEAALVLQPAWPKGSFRKGKALRGLQVPWRGSRDCGGGGGSRGFSLVRDRGGWAGGTLGVSLCPHWVPNPFCPSTAGWATGSCQDTGDKSVTGGSARTRTRDPEQGAAVASAYPTLPASHPARDCFPLWVGNVTSHINEKVLRRAFGRFGEIRSVRMLPGRRCAFINFCGKAEAEEAFSAMQGATVEGSKLLLQLKHPAHATPAP
ncbi:TTC31 protein, partial [Certhia brachydactyla]|nr:TTC31 protein [Certhia brachydactyla]